jgi:hypothetical protein
MLTVAGFVYATYISFHRSSASGDEMFFDMTILAALFFLTCALPWFLRSYWQGQDWTRTFVMIGLVLKVGYHLIYLHPIHHFPHSLGMKILFSIRIVDMLFSVYIFCWLLTKQARRYFASPRIDWEPTDQPRATQ